jgi:hypothetical protein
MATAGMGRSQDQSRGLNGGDSDVAMAGRAERGAAPRDVAAQAREVAGDVAGQVVNRLPAAAASTREAITTATRQMESSSDEMLTAGTMLSLGVALGLLLAGSNRLLVAIALIPAAAMGATLIDRRSRISPD